MRIAFFVLLLALVPACSFPQSSPAGRETRASKAAASVPGGAGGLSDSLSADLAAVESFYPRLEGSAGEKKTVSFITARLKSMGIPFSTFDFSQSDFQHSFSTCIRVDIEGTSRDTLIIAVPLDHAPDAAAVDDGAANIAIALGFLSRLRRSVPPVSVTVLFLGAEFGTSGEYPLGSRLFLRDYQPQLRAMVVYLNLRGIPSRVAVRAGGSGVVSPYWLIERTVSTLREAGLGFDLRGYENQVFRLGLSGESTIIEPYLRAGYPAVSLEGKYEWEHSVDVQKWLSSSQDFLSGFLTKSAGGIPEDWDLHYLLLQLGGFSLIVTEKQSVILLLSALAAVLLYSLLFRRGLKKYMRTMTRNFWSIIPIYAIPFVLLLASTYVLEGILALRGFPSLWTYAPLPFLALKLTVPLLLFSILYGAVHRLRFPRNGSFYSAAAILFLLIDILVVAAINVSYSFYFLWAFVFVVLASVTSNRWAKLALFLPSSFWGIRGLMEIFLIPALPFCHTLLLSPIKGNLLIAAVMLPFVLFVIRLGLLFRGPTFMRRGSRQFVFASLFASLVIPLAVGLMFFSPFNAGQLRPVTVTQTIDEGSGKTEVAIESPGPLGDVTIRQGAETTRISSRSPLVVIPLEPAKVPVEITKRESEFLDKKNVFLEVKSGRSLDSLTVVLTSTEDFILLDCTYPFVRESAREYRLLVGAFPPDPLPIQLTLPSRMEFTLTLTMEFSSLVGVEVDPREGKVHTRLHYVKPVDLHT